MKKLLALTAAAVLVSPLASQDEKKPYKPMGAPPDPKVEERWNRYHDYAAITKLLQSLEKAHPALCRLESMGDSFGGRKMWVFTLTNSRVGREAEKPAFYIDGGIHANELQGPEVVAYTAWFLAEMHGRSEFVTRLLDERVFYLVPMVSPDSRDEHMYEPNTTHSPRSGQRPVDDDNDGLVDEDGPDDLDGDGSITQMRVADPNGRWKEHPEHQGLMIRCRADEPGTHTILGAEGIDNDGDGRVNEDGDGFYDPNRDWAWNWQPAHVQGGAHRYPFSILENRAIADFVMAHPNIAGAQSFHNSGGMILRGPGAKDDQYDGADIAVYDAIGRRGEQMLPGYRYMNVAYDLYEVYGGELDWFYAMQGIFTFSNELFTPFNFFRRASEEGMFGRQDDARTFDKFLLFEEGLVKWHAIDHPQYGKVEVGGLRKEWMRQPPSFLLEEECHRNMAFTLYHADQMPQVRVQSIATRALDGGLVEVTATIANAKVTPTRAAVDVRNRISPPDRIALSAKDLIVVAAHWDESAYFTSPTEQMRAPATVEVPKIGGMGAVHVRWIVKGGGPYTVEVRSAKGGVHALTR